MFATPRLLPCRLMSPSTTSTTTAMSRRGCSVFPSSPRSESSIRDSAPRSTRPCRSGRARCAPNSRSPSGRRIGSSSCPRSAVYPTRPRGSSPRSTIPRRAFRRLRLQTARRHCRQGTRPMIGPFVENAVKNSEETLRPQPRGAVRGPRRRLKLPAVAFESQRVGPHLSSRLDDVLERDGVAVGARFLGDE